MEPQIRGKPRDLLNRTRRNVLYPALCSSFASFGGSLVCVVTTRQYMADKKTDRIQLRIETELKQRFSELCDRE